ncbi:MAG: hypothetical protein AAF623_21120, partial [Planctomycetota bacterium]
RCFNGQKRREERRIKIGLGEKLVCFGVRKIRSEYVARNRRKQINLGIRQPTLPLALQPSAN